MALDMPGRNCLLDTCVFLWLVTDDPGLSIKARQTFELAENAMYLSAASTWEIAIKVRLGKLAIPEPLFEVIPMMRERHGILPLPIEEEDTLTLNRLPMLHKDPFDRILIAQALTKGLWILTPDSDIRRYPVMTTW